MSKLDDIKQRAAERRERRRRYSTLRDPALAIQAESDLELAIAIAEDVQSSLNHWVKEAVKAQVAALRLRGAVWPDSNDEEADRQEREQVLAETEWLEQYR